jgi:MFS family permease
MPLFLIFFLWGIVRAAVFGPARGYIGARVPVSSKASLMAVYATFLATSRGLGALTGGFVADRLSYAWDFYLAAMVAVLGGLLLVATFRTAPMFSPIRATSILSLDMGFVRGSAFRRPFAFQCAVAALYFWGSSTMSFLPLLATQVVGLKTAEVGILFMTSALVNAALLIPMGRLADRLGRKRLMITGLFVFGVGIAGLAFSRSYLYLFLSVGIQSLGGAMFAPAAVALVSDTIPPHLQGSAMGIYGAFEDVGVIAGAALSGLVWTAMGPAAVFLTGAVTSGLGALLTTALVSEPQVNSGGAGN